MYASEDFFRSEEGTDIQSVVQDKYLNIDYTLIISCFMIYSI